MYLSMGSPRNAPPTLLCIFSHLSNTAQELGIITMIALGSGPFKNPMTLAKYPDLFEDGAIRTEMERLESQWMVEQDHR